VTGLAFDPLNGLLYGSTGGTSGKALLTIDPVTAVVTVVGNYNAGNATMADLAFDPSGHLFGIGSAGTPALYSINLATGQATAVGASGLSGSPFGGGLGISPAGAVYGVPQGNNFGSFDPSTGSFTFIATLPQPAGTGTSYAALAFDGNTLYGIDLGTPPQLVTIDPATGTITDLGPTPLKIDAIAFQPIPEPGLTGLLVAMAAAVFATARSRNAKKQ
jgi:hypothetical protein